MDKRKQKQMNTLTPLAAMPELSKAWIKLQGCAPLRTIHNQADFDAMRELADSLADSVGDDESHPLYSLFEISMDLIEYWESTHVEMPNAPPREVLRLLLESNQLKQKDLADIASPTLLSDILAGRREISKRLAKLLAARFHVSVGAFI
jgi:HTH-type transcriptional regulator/antitoxin HigA